jgi:hypothetical protein
VLLVLEPELLELAVLIPQRLIEFEHLRVGLAEVVVEERDHALGLRYVQTAARDGFGEVAGRGLAQRLDAPAPLGGHFPSVGQRPAFVFGLLQRQAELLRMGGRRPAGEFAAYLDAHYPHLGRARAGDAQRVLIQRRG